MAAHLKKRALAEFSHVIQEEAKPPPKKLRLIHKPKIVESQLNLQNATTSHDALQALLRFEDSLPVSEDHVEQSVRVLLEHLYKEKESAVRVKVMMLLAQLSNTPGYDPSPLVDDITAAMKREESHKVLAQMLSSLLAIGSIIPNDEKAHATILEIAEQHLSDSCHNVRCRALEVIGGLGTPEPRLQQFLEDFATDGDPRVRTAALHAMLRWHTRGLNLKRGVYDRACASLTDSSETVRMIATKLVWVVSQLYPEEIIAVPESQEEIRLVDDGFAKICNMVNDGCMRVRAEAAGLLGSLHAVSQRFLEQTLDKKLMSNMRKKTSAHERQREHFKSGEWSTGKKWADDAPKENVDAEQISLISSGACGAFVHGFEDEYMEVRNAAIDSFCELATRNGSFAAQSQDFLVDMFNDEIESVRLNAINSLRKISHHIVLREDQLDIIICCLKDFNYEIRDALREMFHFVRLDTKACLRGAVLGLLDNLKRYPQDRMSIWKCCMHLGINQPSLALPMLPDLLSIHPYYESMEPDMDDPAYVGVLLLVFNAAVPCPTMISMFPEHTVRHYTYLRDTFPDMVPQLQLTGTAASPSCSQSKASESSGSLFLEQTLQRLSNLDSLEPRLAKQVVDMAIRDLCRVSEVAPNVSATAECVSVYLQCQQSLNHVLATRETTPCTANTQAAASAANAHNTVAQVLSRTYQLEHQFIGLSTTQLLNILQLRLRAQTLQLLDLLRINTGTGTKAACIHYLQVLNTLGRSLSSHQQSPDAFTQSLLADMDKLEQCEPSVYLTHLQGALKHHKSRVMAVSNCLQKATANLTEPTGTSDTQLKFIAGLTAGVPLVATLDNIPNIRNIRIQVEYPDQTIHILTPKMSDIRQLSPLRHRIVTTVLLSHIMWSEACDVKISLVLCYEADKEITLDKTDNTEKVVQLCKPVKVPVAPKPVKR